MTKFGFRIKTRSGIAVDSVMVAANDRAEAERKLVQIYHQCEILDCHVMQQAREEDDLSLESAIALIGREASLEASPKKPS